MGNHQSGNRGSIFSDLESVCQCCDPSKDATGTPRVMVVDRDSRAVKVGHARAQTTFSVSSPVSPTHNHAQEDHKGHADKGHADVHRGRKLSHHSNDSGRGHASDHHSQTVPDHPYLDTYFRTIASHDRRHSHHSNDGSHRHAGGHHSQPVPDHPYLDTYFRTIARNLWRLKEEQSHGENSSLMKEIKKLARDAFKYHDSDGDGFLDSHESQVFLKHYVHCLFLFCFHEEAKELNDRRHHPNINAAPPIELQAEAYHLDTLLRNRAALLAMSMDKDGRLQESVVVHALTPGHNTHYRLHQALGLQIKWF